MYKFINEFKLYVRLQWLDRIQTSAFLVGITIQALFHFITLLNIQEKGIDHLLEIYIKSSLFALVGMMLLSSMSALNNEFRYDTIKNLILSKTSISKLIFMRTISMMFISLPVILIPGINIALYDLGNFLILTIMLCLTVFSFGIQATYFFNIRRYPAGNLPWFEYLYITIGCGVIPLPILEQISMVFPPYWIRKYVYSQDQCALFLFLITVIIPPFLCKLYLSKKLDSQIEKIILDGRAEL